MGGVGYRRDPGSASCGAHLYSFTPALIDCLEIAKKLDFNVCSPEVVLGFIQRAEELQVSRMMSSHKIHQ